MRPLSLVPMSTPPCGAGATEKAVTACELQSTSEPPSARTRKTALRAFASSLRLRAGVCGCEATCAACAPPPTSSVTVIVTDETLPDALETDEAETACGRADDAAS